MHRRRWIHAAATAAAFVLAPACELLQPAEPECGNGRIEGDEWCDDGNLAAGDGCDDLCVTELGWECDGGGCCLNECGGDEAHCDESLGSVWTCGPSPDGPCFIFLQSAGCGGAEECEDALEPPACIVPACGDAYVGGEEQCDDGNEADADGCSAECVIEANSRCTGEPSVCCVDGGGGPCPE